jgi:hypothetical protein
MARGVPLHISLADPPDDEEDEQRQHEQRDESQADPKAPIHHRTVSHGHRLIQA